MTPPRSAFGASPPEGGRRLRTGRAGSVAAAWVGLGMLGSVFAAHAQAPNAGKFTLEQVEAGKAQFHRTCAQCHGRNMVNSGTTVYDLRKFPLEDPERFFNSVTQGKGNMPSFKDALTREQIELLWSYVGTRGGKEL
jgi:cytochrome c6